MFELQENEHFQVNSFAKRGAHKINWGGGDLGNRLGNQILYQASNDAIVSKEKNQRQ